MQQNSKKPSANHVWNHALILKILEEELSCPSFYERVANVTNSPCNDLYFNDESTGNWQHVFRMIDFDTLVMRPSTVENYVSHSSTP
jgi:hypothetical protein